MTGAVLLEVYYQFLLNRQRWKLILTMQNDFLTLFRRDLFATSAFGNSPGALIGFDLIIRYPKRVNMLIAHEPPVEGILDEFDRGQQDISAAFNEGGIPAAMKQFFSQFSANYEDLEAGVTLPPRNPQEAAIRGHALMLYTFPAIHGYRLDLNALKPVDQQVILACGIASQTTSI